MTCTERVISISKHVRVEAKMADGLQIQNGLIAITRPWIC